MSRQRSDDRRGSHRYPEATEFGLAYLLLATLPLLDFLAPRLAFHAGNAVPSGLPGAIFVNRSWFWVVTAMVVLGLAAARIRGVDIPFGRPADGAGRVVSIAVLGPTLVAGGLAVVVHVPLGSSVAEAGSLAAIPDLSPGFLLRNAVVPGLLVGLGYGILFYGAIQERLRAVVGTADAVLGTTVLAGFYHWLVDPVWTLARSNLLLLVALVFVVGTALATVELSRLDGDASLRTALSPTRLVALVLAGFLAFTVLVDLLSGATTPDELVLAAGWFGVLGLGAWCFERARSVWVPVVAVAVFQTTLLALPFFEATFQLA